MPKKTIDLGGRVGLGTAKVNNYGFPKIQNAVSKSTVKQRIDVGIETMDCDPVCDMKYWSAPASRYGYSRQQMMNIANAHQDTAVKFHYVQVGKSVFFCTTSCDWFFSDYYWPKRNETWRQNFYTDVTG